MGESLEFQIGQKIRMTRVRQGLSLRALAQRSGLSTNAISLIERGENSATVSSLHRLATALDVPISMFFHDESDQSTVFVRHNQGYHHHSNGITLVSLGNGMLSHQLEAFSVLVSPGAGTMQDPISHQGDEFVRCLEGQLEYYVGERAFIMNSGDSLLFDATQPHCFRNTTQSPATILKIFHAGEELRLARQRHLEV